MNFAYAKGNRLRTRRAVPVDLWMQRCSPMSPAVPPSVDRENTSEEGGACSQVQRHLLPNPALVTLEAQTGHHQWRRNHKSEQSLQSCMLYAIYCSRKRSTCTSGASSFIGVIIHCTLAILLPQFPLC